MVGGKALFEYWEEKRAIKPRRLLSALKLLVAAWSMYVTFMVVSFSQQVTGALKYEHAQNKLSRNIIDSVHVSCEAQPPISLSDDAAEMKKIKYVISNNSDIPIYLHKFDAYPFRVRVQSLTNDQGQAVSSSALNLFRPDPRIRYLDRGKQLFGLVSLVTSNRRSELPPGVYKVRINFVQERNTWSSFKGCEFLLAV